MTYLDDRIAAQDKAMKILANEHEGAKRLLKLRGVGPTIATALIAAIADGKMFSNGREAAAWVGVVPGQHSSGGKDKLLGISKRGNEYLRTLLIHGARAVIRTAKDKDDKLSRWIQSLCQRRNKNIAAVALANKTMRMAWAILTTEAEYDPNYQPKKAEAAQQPA